MPGGVQRPPPPPHCRASGTGISIGPELEGVGIRLGLPIHPEGAHSPDPPKGARVAQRPPPPPDPPQGAPKRPPREGGEQHRPRPLVGVDHAPSRQARTPPPRGAHTPPTLNPDSGRGPFKWRRRSEPSTRCKPTGGRRRRPIGCAERGTRSDRPRCGRGSRDLLTSGCRGNAERSPERGSGATARIATGAWKTWGGSTRRSGSGRAGSTEPGAGDGRGLAGHGGVRGWSTAGVAGLNGAPRFPPVPTRPPAKRGADRTEWARHPAPRPPLNPLAAASPGPSPAAVPGRPVRPHRHGLYLPAGGPTRPSPGAATASPKPERLPGAGPPGPAPPIPGTASPGIPSRAALPPHRAEPGTVRFPSRDSAHPASPPAAPLPAPSVPPASPGVSCRRDPGPSSQRGGIQLSAARSTGGSAIAPAPGTPRLSVGRERGTAGSGRSAGAVSPGVTAPGSALAAGAAPAPLRLYCKAAERNPPEARCERAARGRSRLPAATGTASGRRGGARGWTRPAAGTGMDCVWRRADRHRAAPRRCPAPVPAGRGGGAEPGPPRGHPGGAAGRHALGTAAGPLKARGPRAPRTAPARRARGGSRRSLCPPLASHPSLVPAAVIGSARCRAVDQWGPRTASRSRPLTAAAVSDGGLGQLAARRRAPGGQ
ncbi:basic proline-rich protein-like [Passer domesticus]|uniref:basic proline-rich protein-like n=1 Tax=Passer domesticus TaxID=48849 RepID=UPI0030FE8F87